MSRWYFSGRIRRLPMRCCRFSRSSSSWPQRVLLYSSQLSMIKQFIAGGTAAAFLVDALVLQDPDIVAVPFLEPIYFDTVLLWKRDQYIYSDVERFLRFAGDFNFVV